jgi:dsRNA-specific ribonuclease
LPLIIDGFLGWLFEEFSHNINICDKFLSILNFYDAPCLQNIKFDFSHSKVNEFLGKIDLPFKNGYLVLHAFTHSSFFNQIDESKMKGLPFFSSLKNSDKKGKKILINESDLSFLEEFSKQINSTDSFSVHNERLVFLGEGYLDHLIQMILIKNLKSPINIGF